MSALCIHLLLFCHTHIKNPLNEIGAVFQNLKLLLSILFSSALFTVLLNEHYCNFFFLIYDRLDMPGMFFLVCFPCS